ncbi:MAG: glycosyltransferase family 9 protein, partial [Endomicrobiales bacterium]
PAGHLNFIDGLRDRRFDAAVIFTSFPQSPHPPAYACFLAGIPLRIGQSKEFGGSLLTRWVKPLPDYLHQADRDLHLLEAEGFPPCGRHLELRVPDEVQGAADTLLARAGIGADEPFIVIAPGASCQARRYDALRFAEMIRLLAGKTEIPLLLAGSDRETALEETIFNAGCRRHVVSLIGRTSLPELAAVIRRARLVVANDSGSMHLADAFDRPMVILFSGTDIEEQWRPRKAPARLLRRTTRCAPCYQFACVHAMECLDIPPQEVAGEVLDLLASSESARQRTEGTVREPRWFPAPAHESRE